MTIQPVVIDLVVAAEGVKQSNKDHIDRAQPLIKITFLELFVNHHRLVAGRPLQQVVVIDDLHLQIKPAAILVFGKDVQAKAPAVVGGLKAVLGRDVDQLFDCQLRD